MTVTVKLFATLGKYLPPGSRRQAEVRLDDATATAGDALAHLGVPREEAHLIAVNGASQSWDALINDGDTVAAFPPVAGGQAEKCG
jgi:molybdopterin converting factor small subunit